MDFDLDNYKLKKITRHLAKSHIKNLLIVGIISIIITLFYAIFSESNYWIDVVILSLLVFGAYCKKNKISAIVLFIYFLISKIIQFADLENLSFLGIIFGLIFLNYYLLGMLGVIKYNQLIKKEKKESRGGFLYGILVGILAIISLFFLIIPDFSNEGNVLNSEIQEEIISSVVNIYCPYADQVFGLGSLGTGGSGTVFTEDGIIITNSHIIPQDGEFLDVTEQGCFIVLPDKLTGSPKEIYLATPVVMPELSDEYDLALLYIYDVYIDEEGYQYGSYPKEFDIFDDGNYSCSGESVKLGEEMSIYGYPSLNGGYSLTITDGVVSSFPGDGIMTTSAKIDEGNSGGLAVDKNGCMLGIPSSVNVGEYESMGIIISMNLIEEFINKLDEALNN